VVVNLFFFAYQKLSGLLLEVQKLIMSNSPQQPEARSHPKSQGNQFLQWFSVLVLVYFIIVAVSLVSLGFRTITADEAEELFAFASNPILGLIIGMLASALTQSSSSVSSITVGLVAGGLPVDTAVFIIMGANIGTSLTSTIVSLGSIGKKLEFKRAFAAATIHDMFNLLSVVVFLPIEILFHPLRHMSLALAKVFAGEGSLSMSNFNFVRAATEPVISFFRGIAGYLPDPWNGLLLIVIGIALILFCIGLISKLLKVLLVGRAQEVFETAVGRGPIAGIAAGTLITILVQSSSTTTALIVPLAAAGVMTLQQIYPFTLGANIGTTITGLLAATGISGGEELLALQIAMVHLLYNFFGVIIIYGIPFFCRLPIVWAESLANIVSERKYMAFVYMIGVFFVIPGFLLGATYIFDGLA